MKAKAAFNLERCKELERTLNHDVIAFTTNVAENIGAPASRWLHFGLTSSDVIDTAFAVQMVQSADILIEDVSQLRKIIREKARTHKLIDDKPPMRSKGWANSVTPTIRMTAAHDLDVICRLRIDLTNCRIALFSSVYVNNDRLLTSVTC